MGHRSRPLPRSKPAPMKQGVLCKTMKLIIAIIALILIVFFASNFLRKSYDATTLDGNIDNIEGMIEGLMNSSNEYAFLVIKIHGTEDFIQFTGGPEGVQLDFPLITDRQKNLESTFKRVGRELNLIVIENKGSDGSRFLDIELNGNASEITEIITKFIGNLFNVSSSTKLAFEYDI